MNEKTEKELAFLRGLYVENDWTPKFTDIFDEKFKKGKPKTFLYVNAGTGNHALGLMEKFGEDTEVFASCENSELRQIAQEKANAIKAGIDFSTSLPMAQSELVLADASFVAPRKVSEFLSETVEQAEKRIAFYLPTSGSFGEVFSYLWEVLLDLDLLDAENGVEDLIQELPVVTDVKDKLRESGFRKIESTIKSEFLEFEDGKDFVESPLIKYFLMPGWVGFLQDKEKEQVINKLAQKIDDERDELTFRCSIKATLFSGDRT